MQGIFLGLVLLCLTGADCAAQTSAEKAPAKPARRNLAILIFNGVQIIDYTGPYEVFGGTYTDKGPAFNVYTVAEKPDAITTAMGMSVNPKYSFDDAPKPDVLLIPGGGGSKPGMPGVGGVLADPRAISWVQEKARGAELVMSVCNGAFILAQAGLLDGLTATTTAPLINLLAEASPKTKLVNDRRFVDNGKIITTGGLSSGIDGALHVVEKLFGRGTAQMVALGIEYNWDPESKFARAALADRYMRFVYDVDGAESTSREGTTERWENRWTVASELSAAQILDKVNASLAEGKTYGPPGHVKWVRQDDGKEKTRSAWRFVDQAGGQWQGAASVEPLAGEKNKYRLSVRVAKEKLGAAR
jgi:putative intracellular protease/amidase